MKINYLMEDLEKIIYNIHKISGYTISIWDANMKQLVSAPTIMAEFCLLIKNHGDGNERCLRSDAKVLSEAKEKRGLAVHRCHAGLVDAALPIINGDNILGYIMYGQLAESEDERFSFPMVWECLKDLDIDRDELEKAFHKIRYIDTEGVYAIAEILNFCISYIVSRKLIVAENDELADYITDYIDENLTGDLSIKTLCRQFAISKNTLYRVCHDCYGTTILDYVTKKRIDKACLLLQDPSLSVTEICDRIGISDCNYFFKLFKKRMGVSPLKYRANIKEGAAWTN